MSSISLTCKEHAKPVMAWCMLQHCLQPPPMCQLCLKSTHLHDQQNQVTLEEFVQELSKKKIERLKSLNSSEYIKFKDEIHQLLESLATYLSHKFSDLDRLIQLSASKLAPVDLSLRDVFAHIENRRYHMISRSQIRSIMDRFEGGEEEVSGTQNLFDQLLEDFQDLEKRIKNLMESKLIKKHHLSTEYPKDFFDRIRNRVYEEASNLHYHFKASRDLEQSKTLIRQAMEAQSKGLNQQSLTFFSKAIQLDPQSHIAFNNKGILLKNMDRFEEALQCFSTAINLRPAWPLPYVNKANSLRLVGKNELAIQYYKQAVQLQDKSFPVLYNYSQALFATNRLTEAYETVLKAQQLDKQDQDLQLLKSKCLGRQARFSEAVEVLEQVLKHNPESDQAFFQMGNIFQKESKFDLAFKSFESANKLKPDDRTYLAAMASLVKFIGKSNDFQYYQTPYK